MITPQIDTGITGAKRQSWRPANPRDVLKRLIDKSPQMTEEEIQAECWDALHRNEQQVQTIFEYWFANNYRSLMKSRPDESAHQRRAAEKQAVEGAIRRKVEEAVEARVKIVLLDMVLPTGKAVRDATREELLDLGGWASRVAGLLQPRQTVAEAGITEDQLRGIYES